MCGYIIYQAMFREAVHLFLSFVCSFACCTRVAPIALAGDVIIQNHHHIQGEIRVSWRTALSSDTSQLGFEHPLATLRNVQTKGSHHMLLATRGAGFLPMLYFSHGQDNRQTFLSFLMTRGLIDTCVDEWDCVVSCIIVLCHCSTSRLMTSPWQGAW